MSRADTRFLILFGVLVTSAIAAGLLIVDPPWVERDRAFDRERLHNIWSIATAIRKLGKAPKSLDEIPPASSPSVLKLFDPQTRQPYRYKASGDDAYEICLTFSRAFDQKALPSVLNIGAGSGRSSALQWDHRVGDHCYQFKTNSDTPLTSSR